MTHDRLGLALVSYVMKFKSKLFSLILLSSIIAFMLIANTSNVTALESDLKDQAIVALT
jgi:hypothetical protein